MNYRHAYHAGNFADVVKHVVLVALIEALKQKQTAFHVIDTHAGAGRYDLSQVEAQKTGEYREGIGRLLGIERLPTLVHAYLNLVRSQQTQSSGIQVYPGSPQISRLLLRDQDRLTLCELQDEELMELKRLFRTDQRVSVHARDGYDALNALLPPKEKRGLVLIDPPFEAQEDEFRIIEQALEKAQTKWPTGIFAIWYPIKLRAPIQRFHRFLRESGFRKVLNVELLLHPDNSALRLNGCGLAILNAPFKLDRTLAEIMPVLAQHLAQGRFSQHQVNWVVED